MKRRRVLLYNWADPYDPERRGGGVSVHLRALLRHLARQHDTDVHVVSSGLEYDFFSRRPRWRRISRRPVPRYAIVNSGVFAPGHDAFEQRSSISHTPTTECFADLLRRKGPFDVVHFHNLEGLPADVLALRRDFPETKFVVSMHNYFPFCSQVNLWHAETHHCESYEDGRRCFYCLPRRRNLQVRRRESAAATLLGRLGWWPGAPLWNRAFFVTTRAAYALDALRDWRRSGSSTTRQSAGLGNVRKRQKIDVAEESHFYRTRRKTFVDMLNRHADRVLSVSRRTDDIVAGMGVRSAIRQVAYIGTPSADRFRHPIIDLSRDYSDGFRIAFLGYMRLDKGFFFLLDFLEWLPDHLASKIEIVIAAPPSDRAIIERIARLGLKFSNLNYHHGYGHDELDDVLSGVDFGIVPVLWEDNLPQVAIEMHSRGIPLVVSDKGGAQELGDGRQLVFAAGSFEALLSVFERILAGGFSPSDYWSDAQIPKKIPEHWAELIEIYEAEPLSPELRTARKLTG